MNHRRFIRYWLGTYPTADMAARAHDVAALAVKDASAFLNFPHLAHALPRPASAYPKDIRVAAATAPAAQEMTTSHSSTNLAVKESASAGRHGGDNAFLDLPDLSDGSGYYYYASSWQLAGAGADAGFRLDEPFLWECDS